MRPRGFTAIELSLTLSLAAVVGAAVFTLLRNFERQDHLALADADAARGMRAFSEELRRDLRTMKLEPGAGVVLRGACGRVEYVLEESGVVRQGDEACGPKRAVCAGVASLERAQPGVTLVFSRRVDDGLPAQTRLFLALEQP